MSSVIEKRLERADEDADKKWHEIYGGGKVVDQDEQKTAEAPVQYAQNTDTVEAQADPQPPQATTEVDPAAPEPQTPPNTKDDELTYKQRYKTLEGKYRAEVPRLAQEVKQWKEAALSATAKSKELEERIAALELEKRPKIDTEAIERLEAEVPGSGKVLNQVIADYEARINDLSKKLAGMSPSVTEPTQNVDIAELKRKQFDTDMRSLGVPDWRDIDNDEEFHAWLGGTIPYTRITRAEAVMKAAREYDAETAAQIFLDYKKVKVPVAPTKTEEELEAERQQKLTKQVVPKTGAAPPAKTRVSAQSQYTRDDYTRFMRESSKDRFNPANWGGKTEEQVEAMFDKLLIEGNLS
jgi:hypothetical protein